MNEYRYHVLIPGNTVPSANRIAEHFRAMGWTAAPVRAEIDGAESPSVLLSLADFQVSTALLQVGIGCAVALAQRHIWYVEGVLGRVGATAYKVDTVTGIADKVGSVSQVDEAAGLQEIPAMLFQLGGVRYVTEKSRIVQA